MPGQTHAACNATPTMAELSDIDGGEVILSHGSLFEYFEPAIRDNPDGPAVVVKHQAGDHLQTLTGKDHSQQGHLTWTYRDLHQASFRLASAFLNSRLQPECSTIICFIPNGIEWALLLWTSMLLKMPISPLDMGGLWPQRSSELESYLTSIKADAIIVPDVEGATAVDAMLKKLNLEPYSKIVLAGTHQGWSTLLDFGMNAKQIMSDTQMVTEARKDDLDRVSIVLFTSGTSSGKPKGCPRSVSNVMHFMERVTWIEEGGNHARNIVQTANFRGIAHAVTLQTWKAGGAIIMPSALFDAAAMLEVIPEATLLALIPFQVHSIVDHPEFSKAGNIRLVCIGADMITKDLVGKCKDAFPSAKVMTIHAMTEGGGLCKDSARSYFGGVASVGVVPKGMRLRIWDGQVTRRGVPGEMQIRCETVIKRYLDRESLEDGWFKTGDVGMIDEDGTVYVLGRIKDVIKRVGVTITPAAIENCIERRAGVVSEAVLGGA